MANEDFDSLKDLLDGLDSEIAALSFDQTTPHVNSKAPTKSASSNAPPTKSQYGQFASSEYAISHSLFNTPPLPFKVRAVQDYMNDMGNCQRFFNFTPSMVVLIFRSFFRRESLLYGK
jgi:hypothetical protein